MVQNLPASAGDTGSIPILGRFLGGGNAIHSSIPAWKIPWTEETGWPTIHGIAKSWTQKSTLAPRSLKGQIIKPVFVLSFLPKCVTSGAKSTP